MSPIGCVVCIVCVCVCVYVCVKNTMGNGSKCFYAVSFLSASTSKCMYTYTHYIYTCTHIITNTCMYIHIHTHTHTHMNTHTHRASSHQASSCCGRVLQQVNCVRDCAHHIMCMQQWLKVEEAGMSTWPLMIYSSFRFVNLVCHVWTCVCVSMCTSVCGRCVYPCLS